MKTADALGQGARGSDALRTARDGMPPWQVCSCRALLVCTSRLSESISLYLCDSRNLSSQTSSCDSGRVSDGWCVLRLANAGYTVYLYFEGFWAGLRRAALRSGHGGQRSRARAPELGGLTDRLIVGAPVLGLADRFLRSIPGHQGTRCRLL